MGPLLSAVIANVTSKLANNLNSKGSLLKPILSQASHIYKPSKPVILPKHEHEEEKEKPET